MVKLSKNYRKEVVTSSDEDDVPQLVPIHDDSDSDDLRPYEEQDSDLDIVAQDQEFDVEGDEEEDDFGNKVLKEFGQRGINEEERMLERLKEIKANFYNSLNSKRILKK